jgi:hypothetical protein
MAIIYSYPTINNIQSTDLLLGVSTVMYNGKPKNQTKSFELGVLATFLAPIVAPLIPAPSLQQVLNIGNTATKTINISVPIDNGSGGNFVSVNSNGIFGSTASGQAGVCGEHTGNGYAGYFYTDNGTGLIGVSDTGNAIVGSTNEGVGVAGSSVNGYGGNFTSEEAFGLYASSITDAAIRGSGDDSYGGYFTSNNGSALYAYSQYNNAIIGSSAGGSGGVFSSSFDSGINVSSIEGNGGYFYSRDASAGYFNSRDSYGVVANSQYAAAGYFSSGSTYSLIAAQSAAKPGGGSWSAYSDNRVKENIKPYTKGLNELLLVNPVNYEYNGLAGTIKGIEYTGIIAQEIKDIFPETVNTYKAKLNKEDKEETELYDFNSTALTFALINAVKELSERIKILENK